jgi:hypothetical protein
MRWSKSQKRENDERIACSFLVGIWRDYLDLNCDALVLIGNYIDGLVSQSRGNESIEEVSFYLYGRPCDLGDDFWDKIGQVVGNLRALKRLKISTRPLDNDDDEVIFNSEILACIMSHVRQNVTVDVTRVSAWDAEESRLFARAIHGSWTSHRDAFRVYTRLLLPRIG